MQAKRPRRKSMTLSSDIGSRSLLREPQHPIDRRAADTEAAGDLRTFDTFGIKRADLLGASLCGRHPTLVLAGGLGRGDAVALALQHQASLELGNRTDHRENQLSGRCPGIGKVQDLQARPLGLDPLSDLQQLPGRAPQPIEPSDGQHVAFAQPIEDLVELRTLGDARHLLLEDPLGAGVFELAQLRGKAGLLLGGRDAGVTDNHLRLSKIAQTCSAWLGEYMAHMFQKSKHYPYETHDRAASAACGDPARAWPNGTLLDGASGRYVLA